jgi:large subunit ribosomal protein L18
MEKQRAKANRRNRRKLQIRKRVYGTAEVPRLSVSRSLNHIHVQVINDDASRTLVQASSQNKELRDSVKYGGNREAAASVGTILAQRAIAHGIRKVAFDRNGYRFHGRVKALADAAREAGLKF